MENEDKFAKTIEDENLDAVAGGTSDMAKDIKFLKMLGARLNQKSTIREVTNAWTTLGSGKKIAAVNLDGKRYEDTVFVQNEKSISRNDAMIMTMRAQNKYLNLEDFI